MKVVIGDVDWTTTVGAHGSDKALTKIVDHRLQSYREALADTGERSAPRPADEVALETIDLCQKLERLHPLDDANTRVFCVIGLGELLVRQGGKLSVVDDPNKLDGLSRKEVLQLVREGEQRVDGWRIGGFAQDLQAIERRVPRRRKP